MVKLFDAQDTRDRAQRALAGHVMREEPVRAFRFHSVHVRPKVEQNWEGAYPFAKLRAVRETASFGYDSHYAFTLTWTPGHLALVGDLGELTLVHYQALRRFEDIGWALSADHQYLMSKTDKAQVYDRDATIADLIHRLNEPVIHALNGYSLGGRRVTGLRHDLQEWRREVAAGEDAGDKPEPEPFRFRRCGTASVSSEISWVVPDEWSGWASLWRMLPFSSRSDSPDAVRRPAVRRRLKRALRDVMETAHEAADLLINLGFDGCLTHVWAPHTYFQIAAIQHGVRMILAAAEQPMVAAHG